MCEKFFFTITGLQREISDEATVEHCEGIFERTGEDCYIRYETINGRTEIYISQIKAEVIKTGAIESRMTFIPGDNTSSIYHTPFGDMEADIYTKKVEELGTDASMSFLIVYDLALNGTHVSECELKIDVERRSCGG